MKESNSLLYSTVKKSLLKTLLSVSSIVVLAKLLGFVKQMITASFFGATLKTDMVFLSQGLVFDFDYLLVQALAIAFIPIYLQIRSNEPGSEKRFFTDTLKVVLCISGFIALLLGAFSSTFAKIIAPSYSDADLFQLSRYIRLFCPVLVVIVEVAVLNAVIRANKIFLPGEFVSINQSVIIIVITLLFGKSYGPDILVLATALYAVFNFFFLLFFAKRYGGKLTLNNPFKNHHVISLLKMMGPLLLGYSMVFINQLVDRMIVSGLGTGAITAMSYAAVLSNFVGTFGGALGGVLFAYISQNVAEKQHESAGKLTANAIIQLITVFLPISIITVMNPEDIVSIVYGHGKFDQTAVLSCSSALTGYGFMFVPFVIRELYTRLQYAYNDSKTPMINSAIGIIFNIFLSIILSRLIGVLGVTIATSVSVTISSLLNLKTSKGHNVYAALNIDHITFFRWLLGAVACVIVSVILKPLFNDYSALIRFIVIAGLSLMAYFGITFTIVWPMVKQIKKG